jgi:hypothetical protein
VHLKKIKSAMYKVAICIILYNFSRSMSASGQLSAGMGSLHIGAGRDIHNSKNTSSF